MKGCKVDTASKFEGHLGPRYIYIYYIIYIIFILYIIYNYILPRVLPAQQSHGFVHTHRGVLASTLLGGLRACGPDFSWEARRPVR